MALQPIARAADFGGSLTLGDWGERVGSRPSAGLADQQPLLKVGNWIGPLLVAECGSGCQQSAVARAITAKLVKLAGGIFHTHHHLADGRLEVLDGAWLACRDSVVRAVAVCCWHATSVESALQGASEALIPAVAERVWQAAGTWRSNSGARLT